MSSRVDVGNASVRGIATDDSKTYYRLLYVFGAIIVVGSLAAIIVPAGIKWDFGNFYDAGRRILAGQVNDLYAPNTLIAGQEPQARTGFWGTPLSAYLYLPLALFSPIWGLMLFKLETAVFNIASLVLLYRYNRKYIVDSGGNEIKFAALFAFVGLIFQPIWTAFRTGGQTTPIVFFFLVLALGALTRDQLFSSALYFSIAVMIKPALITAIAVFVLVMGFRYVKYTFYIFATTGLVSLAVMGWHVHQEFLLLMTRGMNSSVPWFYNSGLYTTFENLKLFAPPDSWPKMYEGVLNVMKTVLKLGVLATFAFLFYKSRGRQWSAGARNHFNFLMAICFFSLFGHIVYEAYLTFLFIVLAYVVAASRHFSSQARVLVGVMFFLCFWQNIVWMDLLRYFFNLNSVVELITIGLFKSAPLILLLVFLWRHHSELFASYETASWQVE